MVISQFTNKKFIPDRNKSMIGGITRQMDQDIIIYQENGDEIILQNRPKSYEEYLLNSHDERSILPKWAKPVIIKDNNDEDEEVTITSHRSLSQAQEWLLNQRQGDDVESIPERNVDIDSPSRKDQLSSSLAEEAYNELPDLTRSNKTDNDGSDYFEHIDYSKSQLEEEEDDKPEPGYIIAQMNSLPSLNGVNSSISGLNRGTRSLPGLNGVNNSILGLNRGTRSLPNLNKGTRSLSNLNGVKRSLPLYHVDIPKLTMPQDYLQTGREPSIMSGAINVIPKVELSAFPAASNRGSVLISSGMQHEKYVRSASSVNGNDALNSRSQVGMSESLLQMNIPLFIQDNIGPNASWM